MRTPAVLALLLGSLVAASSGAQADGNLADAVNRKVLRVCATPANLPFSDEKGEGFENKIAQIVAQELKLPVGRIHVVPTGSWLRAQDPVGKALRSDHGNHPGR